MLDDRGAKNLSIGIVKQSVRDWRDARRILKKNPNNINAQGVVIECKKFFLSAHFGVLTGLDGKEFLSRLYEKYGYDDLKERRRAHE